MSQKSLLLIFPCLYFLMSLVQGGPVEAVEKQKILVASLFGGSHIRQMIKNVKELALTKKYNISMLFAEGSHHDKGFEGLDFHPIYVTGLTQQHIDNIGENFKVSKNTSFEEQVNLLIQLLSYTKSGTDLFKFLQEQKYDMILTEQFPHLYILRAMLGIEKHFVIMFDPFDQFFLYFNHYNLQHSTEFSYYTSIIFGLSPLETEKERFSFGYRLKNQAGLYLMEIFFQLVWKPLTKGRMDIPDHHFIEKQKAPDFILAKGVEGIMSQVALSANLKYSYPIVKIEEQREEIDELLEQFLQRSERIMIISFGSSFLPKAELLVEIFNYILSHKDYSYVVVFQEKYVNSTIADMVKNQYHILPLEWIPQKALLQHDKTKVFFTHAGYNSFLETLEFAVPVISYPLSQNDQKRNCELFQELKLGQCLTNVSSEDIHNALKKIEANDFYQENLRQMARVIQKKKEEKEDLIYWVDYVFQVNSSNVNPEQFRSMNLIQKFDLDIKLCIIVPLLLTRFALMGLCRKYCCKKKEKVEKS